MAMDDRFARVLTDPRFKVSKDFFAESRKRFVVF